MPKPAAKIAVSIPEPLYRAIEKARRASRKSRSAIVQEALREWLRRGLNEQLVRDYEAGYRAQGETTAEVEAALTTAVFPCRDSVPDWQNSYDDEPRPAVPQTTDQRKCLTYKMMIYTIAAVARRTFPRSKPLKSKHEILPIAVRVNAVMADSIWFHRDVCVTRASEEMMSS